MRKLFLLATLLAVTLAAQEPKRFVQKVYDVKYADVKELSNVLITDGLNVRFNEHFKTISLYGSAETVAAAEELIKRFDTQRPGTRSSSRNVELTCYILIAAPKGSAGEAVPTDLDPVVKQLKSAFGYNDFRLLDSTFIRAQEGNQVSSVGNAGAPNPDLPGVQGRYEFTIRRGVRISSDDKGARVRLDDFVFDLRLPTAPEKWTNVNFRTDVDIREGQKVVIGKARGDAAAGAYILVLSARVVD
ncbi:MAG TPA: hypothetical protein VGK29_11935 [Paludibaculum sp.]|jgi:hypothetical protein